jgi:hypothetical protein
MDITTESIKTINQLCQTNQNIGFVANILHRGYVAGEVNLSNNEDFDRQLLPYQGASCQFTKISLTAWVLLV